MNNVKGWGLGLFVLFVVYSIYHILAVDMLWIRSLEPFHRKALRFLFALFIFLIGTYFLKKNTRPTAWMWHLWNLVHIAGMLLLLVFGAIHQWVAPLPGFLSYFAFRVYLFLISPLFYAGMGILSRQLNALEGELNKK